MFLFYWEFPRKQIAPKLVSPLTRPSPHTPGIYQGWYIVA